MTDPTPLFQETQRFRQLWLWTLMLALIVLAFCAIASAFTQNRSPAAAAFTAGMWAVFGLGIPVLLMITRLVVEVRPNELRCRFFPFHLRPRVFDTKTIVKCMPCEYRPLRDFGGWGIRKGFGSKGWAYNVSGALGVQLVFKDGRKLLIGSQRPEELALAILDSARH